MGLFFVNPTTCSPVGLSYYGIRNNVVSRLQFCRITAAATTKSLCCQRIPHESNIAKREEQPLPTRNLATFARKDKRQHEEIGS